MKVINHISEIRHFHPNWEERLCIAELNEKRAILLKNRLNQGWKLSDNITQTLVGVELEVVDASEFNYLPSSDRLLKSTKPLPSFIVGMDTPAYLTVRHPSVIARQFNVVTPDAAVYAGNGVTNKRSVFCFIYNSYLYIKLKRENPKIALIDTVSVEGVFEDPLEAMVFNNPDLYGRDLWQQEYPIPLAEWSYIKSMIVGGNNKEETGAEAGTPI